MRVPAISFDPPVGAPTGVARLQATTAASRTAVSPDGRRGGPSYRRAAREADQAAAGAAQAAEPGVPPVADSPPLPPLPASYPPLSAQRAVLDRPAREDCAVVPHVPEQRPDPPAETGPRPPAPGSSLDQTLRRIIGAV